jgi:hypothetical protein
MVSTKPVCRCNAHAVHSQEKGVTDKRSIDAAGNYQRSSGLKCKSNFSVVAATKRWRLSHAEYAGGQRRRAVYELPCSPCGRSVLSRLLEQRPHTIGDHGRSISNGLVVVSDIANARQTRIELQPNFLNHFYARARCQVRQGPTNAGDR